VKKQSVRAADYILLEARTLRFGKVWLILDAEKVLEHTDSWEAELRSSSEEFGRSLESVAVVLNPDRCPESRVCYQLTEGSVDVGVVNDPPTTRGNPLYEDEGNKGSNPLYESRMDTVSLVGFGSFSISKRSARTGRNPQTGKEIQIPADESIGRRNKQISIYLGAQNVLEAMVEKDVLLKQLETVKCSRN